MAGEPRQSCPVVLQTGFRIFFLGAAVHAVVSMAVWLRCYVAGRIISAAMPLTIWHGHEMVFGFTMAVAAGFLLTAVMNWTGLPTLSGTPLLVLFLLWAAARVLAFMPASFPTWPMAACDVLFLVFLAVAVTRPVVAARQWRQSAVLSKLILIIFSGAAFYAALFAAHLQNERKALRFAVYMIVSLIFTIGRRILPFFIERGVGYPVNLRNSRVLDMASLVLLTAFAVIDVFWPRRTAVAALCVLLAAVHTLRLSGWYTPGIWKKPLLWILFTGYAFLIAAFVLKVHAALVGRPDDAALHAFTAGGIGTFTLGMMARVAWGHTGRNIAQAPRQLPLIFVPLAAGAFIRIFLPLMDGTRYALWIGTSQVLWIAAFGLYLVFYFRILTAPRADGQWG